MSNSNSSSFMYELIAALVVLAAFGASAFAESHEDGEDKFDGSEFSASTFIDTAFDRQTYRDKAAHSGKLKIMDKSPRSGGDISKAEHGEESVRASEGEDRKLAKENIGKNLDERVGPVHELPGDWVPDKLDLTSNGGFSVAPDNGSPVPYRLNGHMEIERGRPWEAH